MSVASRIKKHLAAGYALAEIRKDLFGVVVKRHKKVYQFKRPLMGLMEAKPRRVGAKKYTLP